MQAVLVTAFVSYEARLLMVKEALESCGVSCTVLTTDFDHMKKVRRTLVPDGFIAVETKPYAKNISLARILSHRDFARKAVRSVERLAPDIVYVTLPPNSLVKELALFKTRHPKTKLIFDVCDLWPEALPCPLLKKLFFPAAFLWRHLRDGYISKADLILTECDLFRKKARFKDAKTVYWCAKEPERIFSPSIRSDVVELAYLGSINNILDIERTARFVRDVAHLIPVCVHVIGDGERKDAFLCALRSAGARVIDYGAVYDDAKKAQIFSHCRYGINILRKGVLVGLSMKSIDYLKAGLPLLNNLGGDTVQFVRKAGVGINLSEAASRQVATESAANVCCARKRAFALFETTFSIKAVKEKMTLIFKEFLSGGGLEHLFRFPFPALSLALH